MKKTVVYILLRSARQKILVLVSQCPPKMVTSTRSLYLLAISLAALYSVHGLECTVERSSDDAVDDSASILDAFTKCAEDSVITFQKANYSAYTPITLSNLSKPSLLRF